MGEAKRRKLAGTYPVRLTAAEEAEIERRLYAAATSAPLSDDPIVVAWFEGQGRQAGILTPDQLAEINRIMDANPPRFKL